MKYRLPLTGFCVVMLLPLNLRAQAQTYNVNGQSSTSGASEAAQAGNNLSWGSSIEVSRQARAAQDALKKNDYAAAVSFAQQAAKSAPQNAELWFLLGYAARLDQKYPLSVDSYNRGLQRQPNSVRGLAGLAQTYAKMGREQEAEQLLRKVVSANSKDANSLQLAGELILSTDPKSALDLLQRSDSLQPSAHTDLLISHAYAHLGKPDDSQKYLDRAKSRAPKDPEVLRAVAEQFRDEGQYDKAISTLKEIPKKTGDVEADLAYTYQLAGDPHEAAALYSRLAKTGKSNIGLDLSAAQAWISAGEPDQALPFLNSAQQIDGNNYRLHAILAGLAESEDRSSDALNEYKMALSNLPARVPEGPLYPVELHLNLYELYTQQSDDRNAKQELSAASVALQQAQVPEGSRPEMLRLRAAVESASGNFDAANRDLKEALSLAPANVNSLNNYGTLMWKMGQKDAARQAFTKVLDLDHQNREALSSLGYLARDAGDQKLAESYFARAIAVHPGDYAPYLALADLYTAQHNYHAAETNYEKSYERKQDAALTIAGGANAAIEAHNLDLADQWLKRAKGRLNANPQVEREHERYLTFKGQYAESAQLGSDVISKLPKDREGVVYLAYDLYDLGRYDDALALAAKYRPIFPDDKDLPFIAGNVDAHEGHLKKALDDYTQAIADDPKMAAGYSNRGFVFTDLREADKATNDFQKAIQIDPNFGEAHLGLAYAELQLHQPGIALKHLDSARKSLGESHSWHLARAEAFRQEQDFGHAGNEYRIALAETPNDLPTEMAYADVEYHARNYAASEAVLDSAVKVSPSDPAIYALMAQDHAKQGEREKTLRDIQLAEQYGGNQVDTLMATGDALLTLGERDQALQRFSRALDIPGGDRLGVRLGVAEIFMRQGHYDETRRQIAIGFAEARLSQAAVKPDDLAAAANIFLSMHDFELAESYFEKAKLAGANNRTVALGLTNTYLAEGNTSKAESTLSGLGSASDLRDDYDYMMASASLENQRQDPLHALSDFAQASTAAGQEDQGLAQNEEYVAADQEGRPLNGVLSVVPEGTFTPVLEDINVYTLDAKILKVTNPSLLPTPRHSFQSMVDSRYRIHLGNLPVISGFVGQSLTAGRLLYPSIGVVQDRNTYDTIFNGGINPILHFLGSNSIALNAGLQFTVRRDTISPAFMSQNLFKQFLYFSTNSFFNWVSVNGSAVREAGPFTDANLHSRDASANVEFTVGRPWGSTSLITGYSVRDLLFRPMVLEYFNTTSYAGLQHKFGNRFTAAILAEDLRSWRVQNTQYATAQALLPGGRFNFRASVHWSVQGSFVLSRGEGYHAYDNTQSEFLVSYVRSLHGTVRDGGGEVKVAYPIRFSVGVEQQTFYDFPGSTRTTLLPVVHFSLF